MAQIDLYETKDGLTRIEVKFEGHTVWLSQEQMAAFFGKAKSTINEHIKNVYLEKSFTSGN